MNELPNGYKLIKHILPAQEVEDAAVFAKAEYAAEHLNAIKEGRLPSIFTLANPYPKNNCKEILRYMASKQPLEIPTLHGQIDAKKKLKSIFVDLIRKPTLIKILSELLVSQDVFMHLPPWMRVLHKNFGFATVPPHNDLSYNMHFTDRKQSENVKRRFLTIWIPLASDPRVDGGLRVYPNLRCCNSVPTPQSTGSQDKFWIDDMSSESNEWFIPPYERGDVIIFEPDLIHGSAPINIAANEFRISMDVRVFGINTLTTKYYIDLNSGTRYEPGKGPCGH